MKRFYSQFRITLMTFVFGLASVFVFNSSLKYSDDVSIELTQFHSESPVFLFKVVEPPSSFYSGGSGELQYQCRLSKCEKVKILILQ